MAGFWGFLDGLGFSVGRPRASGVGVGTLPQLQGSAVGVLPTQGQGAGTLAQLVGEASGIAPVSGQGVGVLGQPQGAGQGAAPAPVSAAVDAGIWWDWWLRFTGEDRRKKKKEEEQARREAEQQREGEQAAIAAEAARLQAMLEKAQSTPAAKFPSPKAVPIQPEPPAPVLTITQPDLRVGMGGAAFIGISGKAQGVRGVRAQAQGQLWIADGKSQGQFLPITDEKLWRIVKAWAPRTGGVNGVLPAITGQAQGAYQVCSDEELLQLIIAAVRKRAA